jgi:hypothetical protein
MVFMRDHARVEIIAWIECGQCSHIGKRVVAAYIPSDLAIPMLEKVCAVCGYCGAHAVMYLERAVHRMH